MIMLSRLQDESKTSPMSSSRSDLGKFRSSSPLQKSHSGSALSSLNAHHQHVPVYIPGQHSELSTAFLHKHKRGGNLRRHDSGQVIAIERPMDVQGEEITVDSINSIDSTTINSKPYIPTISTDESLTNSTSSSISSPSSVTDNDSDNITIKASPTSSSDDDVDDDDDSPEANRRRQQKMIRKKSGELVKSSLKLPSLLRTQSMPTKMVHFDSNLEHVRKFFRREKPTAVSSGSATPVKEKVSFQWASGSSTSDSDGDNDSETDSDGAFDDDSDDEGTTPKWTKKYLRHHKKFWNIALPNFSPPHPDCDGMVYLDSIFLSSDNSNLIGHICVRNVSFKKFVSIRYTLDFWKTVTEVVADYNGDVRRKTLRNGYDRFTFSIRLNDLPQTALTSNSMFFCVRYQNDSGEFWDNNNSLNYEVLLTKGSKDRSKHDNNNDKSKSSSSSSSLSSSSAPRQASSYFSYQPTSNSSQPQSHHGRNGALKHHHRRTKTDPSPDFLYDNDFDHHHSVDDSTTSDLFENLSLAKSVPKNGNGFNNNNTNTTSNASNNNKINTTTTATTNAYNTLSPTKKSNGLTSRYSFGASLNAALARKNVTNRRPSYDGDADEEITTTSESTSDDESTDGTPTTTNSTTTPQLRSFIFPKSSSSIIRSNNSSSGTLSDSSRPAWDSMSYKDIISKYCFFQDTPATTTNHHHHRAISTTTPTPIHHRAHHHRPTASFIASPMTTSPALIPQSSTPPPQFYTASAMPMAITSPLESSSSTLSSPTTPPGSFSPSPTEAPSSPGESSSDTLLDVSEPRKLWHSVEV